MPFNGSGTFERVHDWTDDADSNIDIEADRMDEEDDGFATGLTNCITKDGQSTVTANIPMAGFKFTGLGAGSANTDSATVGQVQKGSLNWVASGGTADAITAAYSPSVTALTDGMELDFRATGANTVTNPTFSPNGLTARTITLNGGSIVPIGAIPGADFEAKLRYNLANTRWELMNPVVPGPALLASANTFTADQTISSTDAGASRGPLLTLLRSSASPAASDVLGAIPFTGKDSGGNTTEYTTIDTVIDDPADTSEDGRLRFWSIIAGTLAKRFHIGAGLYSEGVTGGDKGAGSINVASLYLSNVQATVTTGASASDQETATSTTTAVTPAVQQRHPSAAKAWAKIDQSGSHSISAGYNIATVTDGGAGVSALTFTTAMSSADYAVSVASNTSQASTWVDTKSTTGFTIHNHQIGGAGNTDSTDITVIVFGDQ